MIFAFLLIALAAASPPSHADAPQATATQQPSSPPPADCSVVRFASPADGDVVARVRRVRLDVPDPSKVGYVILEIDGQRYDSAAAAPFEIRWDTHATGEGRKTLVARAFDQRFIEAGSCSVAVTVDNTSPTVVITQPATGVAVAANAEVAVEAHDDIGIQSVHILLDGERVATVEHPPYRWIWDSNKGPNGHHTLQARAFDLAGNATNSESVTVRVVNANRPPVLDPIGPIVLAEGQELFKVLKAKDADGVRDPLTFTATGLPEWLALYPKAGELRGRPDFRVATLYEPKTVSKVHVEVCDPEPLCDSEDFTVTVTNVNRPPQLQKPGDQQAYEDHLFVLPFQAVEPDGEPITCRARNLPKWASFDEPTCTIRGVPGPTVATIEAPKTVYKDVRLEVCDPQPLCVAHSITITVSEVLNQAPVINPIPKLSTPEGKEIIFQVRATDPDGDQMVLTATDLPEGADFVDHGNGEGTFKWTPRQDQSQTYQFGITVTDGALSTTQAVTLQVQETSYAISGQVLDNMLKGVAGVFIDVNTSKLTIDTVKTDENGYFLVKDLRPDTYVVKPHAAPDEEFSAQARRVGQTSFSPLYRQVIIKDADAHQQNFVVIQN